MAIPRLTTDLDIVQTLDDEPNDVGGLSAAELKAKFDEAPNAVKTWINNTLLPFFEGTGGAGNVGIATLDGLDTATNVQAALQGILYALQDITQGVVPDGSITAAKLAAAAVIAEKLAAGAVTSEKLASNAVTDGKIGGAAVGTANIKDSAVATAKIADGAVSSGKLADGAVTGAKLGTGAVNSEKLGQYAVTSDKLSGGAVTAAKIAANAVSTAYSGTLTAAGWTGSAAPFTQELEITGVLESDVPLLDLIPSNVYSTAVQEDEAWGQIYKAVTGADSITFYAKVKPTVALNFTARCIRK